MIDLKELRKLAESWRLLEPALRWRTESFDDTHDSHVYVTFPDGEKAFVAFGLTSEQAKYFVAFQPEAVLALLDVVEAARAGLEELKLNHEHKEGGDPQAYRPLGDTYGWCCYCSAKVGLNEDVAKEVLANIQAILEGKDDGHKN